MYYYNCFYERLFDIHPLARDLFKDFNSQGKFLVKMISLSPSEKADPDKYEKTLVKLAEMLFWSICKCIDSVLYTMEVHEAWVKIYSRMLKTMVPVAVAHELKNRSAQEKRFFVHNNNFGISNAKENVPNSLATDKQQATVRAALLPTLATFLTVLSMRFKVLY